MDEIRKWIMLIHFILLDYWRISQTWASNQCESIQGAKDQYDWTDGVSRILTLRIYYE